MVLHFCGKHNCPAIIYGLFNNQTTGIPTKSLLELKKNNGNKNSYFSTYFVDHCAKYCVMFHNLSIFEPFTLGKQLGQPINYSCEINC